MNNSFLPYFQPVEGKKRKKLDEIVLGLSAAKEQQIGGTSSNGGASNMAANLPEPPKKSPVSPSSNYAANISAKNSAAAVTSQLLSRTLSAASGKPAVDLASYLGTLEQQNLLLKQQQPLFHHQQSQSGHKVSLASSSTTSSVLSSRAKTYEAMLADFTKNNDMTAKLNSAVYSAHDAKVTYDLIRWRGQYHLSDKQLTVKALVPIILYSWCTSL